MKQLHPESGICVFCPHTTGDLSQTHNNSAFQKKKKKKRESKELADLHSPRLLIIGLLLKTFTQQRQQQE